MSVFSGLLRDVGAKLTGKRWWTPTEVRDLFNAGRLADAEHAAQALAPDTPERELAALCLGGEVAFRQRRDEKAEEAFRAALVISPGIPDAHYGLSLVMLERGEAQPALRHAQFAANAGTAARFSAQLGLCQLALGNYSRAGEALLRATRLDPADKSSWNNLGIARRAHGDLRGARLAFLRSLSLDSAFERAQANLRQLDMDLSELGRSAVAETSVPSEQRGEVSPALAPVHRLGAEGRYSEAVDLCERLCAADPEDLDLVIELAALYRELGDVQSGLDALVAFRTLHPDDISAIAALGKALVKNSEFMEAKPLIQRALDARPDDVSLLSSMAEIRFQQERYVEAGELIERAYELEPSVHMKGRLASNLIARCRYDEGLALIDEMLAEDPKVANDVSALQIMALTYQGKHDEALPKLNALIEKFPNDPQRRFSRATINLLEENYGQGWDDYAFRNLESTRHLRMLPFEQWEGGDLEGKTILIAAEQGLGDQVMFASCLPDVLARSPRRVIVEVIDRVARTIARSFPQCEVIATKQDKKFEWIRDLGEVDCFVLMGDLPRFLRRRREDFPQHDGYLLADPMRVAHWQAALKELGAEGRPQPRIGISWRGGTESTRSTLRSLDVTDLAPLFGAIDATWVCLQYGDVDAELARAADAGLQMQYWGTSIKDLDEFAALIGALDLVITVCNTTVHYAGALGQPVWVMAPRVPEWRYGLRTPSLPWYPSSRIFRQAAPGNWASVIGAVAAELGWTHFTRRTDENGQ
jgi:Flp pilus assembly protein TadD